MLAKKYEGVEYMKKRNIFWVIILLFFLLGIPVVLTAQSQLVPNSPDDFRIANSSLGGVRITRYLGTRQDVVIPETIDGLRVTEISRSAFAIDRPPIYTEDTTIDVTITNVVLPNTLIVIGSWAFCGQPLTSISFPSSVRTIDWYAFYGNNFTSVVIPNGVTRLGDNAFGNKLGESSITSVTIPPSLANYSRPPNGLGFFGAFMEVEWGQSSRPAVSITNITLPANVHQGNPVQLVVHHFHNGFNNAYVGNGRRAGTYIWTGRIWVVQ